ncbi:MAG: hypothetical protein ND807_07745 [Vicinamibacterales bacterium]|nr:hypothetical protein [Vicinamibacterales bacterium]
MRRCSAGEDFYMGIELRGAIAACLTVIIFGVHIIANENSEHSEACVRTLPANIQLSRELGRSLERIYQGSATFRAQCDRIAAAEMLSVQLRFDPHIPRSCQAFTIFGKRGRELHADVHLPMSGSLMAQIVGHEFEHIVEQIDGLDLRLLARIRGTGVYQSSFDVFESVRAQNAGRIVEKEMFAPRLAD